jgi:CheY-like chemotaxis protein
MKKLHILLAEDDEMIRKITTFFLKRNGHEVDIAKNGSEAVKSFKAKEYDVILMDIQMPEMDGLEAVKQIRQIEQEYLSKNHTTIIAVTTNSNKAECLNAGMDAYAQKPYNFDDLSTLFRAYNLV